MTTFPRGGALSSRWSTPDVARRMATRAPHEAQTDSCTYEIDLPAPHDSVAALSDVCAQVLAFISSLSRDYIWHKQQFQLGLSPEQPAQQHRWLTGTTDVTDAVDDEWFIVWLLRRVTNEWHDAAVQIEDDDGEFLLIEAADALPNWVTPQNAANRVRYSPFPSLLDEQGRR
jgi:hypothetical protein